MTKKAALALAAALTAAGLAPRAQAPAPGEPRPTFRVGSDLVVVDLVVTDRDQRFVADLRPEEIRIEEDGRERPLQFLQLVRAGQPGVAPVGLAPSAPRETAAMRDALPTVAAESASLAIVIDLLGTPAEAMPRVRAAIRKMVDEEVPDGTPLMLATAWHGVTVHHPFATDRARFLAALDGLDDDAR
jgi:VWFA-related protein